MSNPFKTLDRFEWWLWEISILVVAASCFFTGAEGLASGIASLIGVTALIFIAKGMIIGQILCIIFSVLYGIIALFFGYYGETFTYIGMCLPMATVALISWIKNPYKDSDVVEIAHLSPKKIVLTIVTTIIVTFLFFFLLDWLHTENLTVSTISIATSWSAAILTFLRSPYYALAYALNDVVLIVLWAMESFSDISCLPMVFCFIMFLANDLYGFYNWKKMQKEQI